MGNIIITRRHVRRIPKQIQLTNTNKTNTNNMNTRTGQGNNTDYKQTT